jgi:uncharacterized cupin superfamily protein
MTRPTSPPTSRIDLAQVPEQSGSRYPSPFDEPCRERYAKRLGDAAGLTRLGVTLVRLAPGAWSGQRHFHEEEDEFLYMLSGELVLVTNAGEEVVRAGDCAAWKAGDRNAHCLQNRGTEEATFLAISNRSGDDHGEYPDIDLKFTGDRYHGQGRYLHKDGRSY